MRIAILGYDRQGRAAYQYWRGSNQITICDKKTDIDLPNDVQSQLGDDYLKNLDLFDLLIRTPGLHPRDIAAANSNDILAKVTTVTEEFIRQCPAPIIGVTGTKGKGTTSSLIAKIIETAGHKVHLGGNIGIAPLEMLSWNIQPSDWVVLELANFQLIDLKVSPKVAVCLMVVPEHLDWHGGVEEYVLAKQNMFRHQTEEDFAVYNRLSDLSERVASVSPAFKLSYEVPEPNQQPSQKEGAYVLGDSIYMDDQLVCKTNDVALLGRHNLQNTCAAITATWDLIGQDPGIITKAVNEFKGLPHRIELVRQFNGVNYYNDSFATAIGATTAAVKAINSPKVLIVGGYFRGYSIEQFAELIVEHANEFRKVILIGQTGPKIQAELDKLGFNNYLLQPAKEMINIVMTARNAAQPGDAVLFSPGFASFDMFKDFEDRGLQFKAAVNDL